MSTSRAARAAVLAHGRLTADLDPALRYHSVFHTVDEVVELTGSLAAAEGIRGIPAELVTVAAWFHDIGFTIAAAGHEAIGAAIAAQTLPDLGYSPGEVASIGELIIGTQLPQRPTTLLQKIICDADLCSLGQPAFFDRSDDLRQELRHSRGSIVRDQEWARSQADFLAGHRYWTASARRRWDVAKAQHLSELRRRADA